MFPLWTISNADSNLIVLMSQCIRKKQEKIKNKVTRSKSCHKLLEEIPSVNDFFIILHLRLFKNNVVSNRSSHQELFHEKGVLKNFAKFVKKHLCWSLFVNKVETQVFTCAFCKIFKNNFFIEHLQRLLLK